MSTTTIQTNVVQEEMNIDDILGFATADNIISPTTETKKPATVFTKEKPVDLSFLDEKEVEEIKKDDKVETPIVSIDDVIKDDDENNEIVDTKTAVKGSTVEFFKNQIEAGKMVVFDDYDEDKQTLDEYLGAMSQKELISLFEQNQEYKINEIKELTPKEFLETLPEELQYAAQYHYNGGKDIKGLFKALAHKEEMKSLDLSNPDDQKEITRRYLSAKSFGTQEEIEEEIETWDKLGVIEKKATQFKPQLDKMGDEIIKKQIADEANNQKSREETTQKWVKNVFTTLEPGELNGLKLNATQQQKLYDGMVKPTYKSAMTGKNTNLLGHLLEKFQFVEPDLALVTEALWLMSDRKGYHESVKKIADTERIEKTVKTLKTEQAKKTGGSMIEEEERKSSLRKVPKPGGNIFKR